MKIRTIIVLVILIIIIVAVCYVLLKTRPNNNNRRDRENYRQSPHSKNERENIVSKLLSLSRQYGNTIVKRGSKLEHHLTRAQLDEILSSFNQSPSDSQSHDPSNYDDQHSQEGYDTQRYSGPTGYQNSNHQDPQSRYYYDQDHQEYPVAPDYQQRSAMTGLSPMSLANATQSFTTSFQTKNRGRNSTKLSPRRSNHPSEQSSGNSSIPTSSAGSKEERCRRILERIFGVPFHKKRPEWLINPETDARLELDCYNEDLKLALEYNGEQHYRYMSKFHESEEDFRKQKERDRQKREICQKRGINLITVPHHVPSDSLYTHIVEHLEKLGYVDITD